MLFRLKKNDLKKKSWKTIVQRTAGLWKHKKIDADTYLRRLREDWERNSQD